MTAMTPASGPLTTCMVAHWRLIGDADLCIMLINATDFFELQLTRDEVRAIWLARDREGPDFILDRTSTFELWLAARNSKVFRKGRFG